MGRLQRKKYRAHAAAAKPKEVASNLKASKSTEPNAALGAAAVAAVFGEDVDENDLVPVDNEQDEDGDDVDGEDGTEGKALSRGQRKRMKKRNAFMRKMGLVTRMEQQKQKEVKKKELGAFAELEALQASLFVADKEMASKLSQATNRVGQTDASSNATGQKKNLTAKQRQRLAVQELGHLKAVHTHPAFQQNAFAAIQMHLQHTVVQANEENIKKATKNEQAKKDKKNAMDVED